jgi:bacterioferritin-associated ferredoxin
VFVCHCQVVSDRDVAAAVDAGADTVDAVGFVTGAGTGCGGCHESIEAILAERCAGCPRALSAVA